MKIGLIGQKWIGEQVFKRLLGQHEIVFLAAPQEEDKTAKAALRAGLPPIYYGDCGLAGVAPSIRCDILITVGSFAYVPGSLRARADWCIGYHPSLLPLYRGRRAVDDAIADGARITGGTVYHLSDDFDAGHIAFQDWCFIGEGETAGALWRRALAPMGVDLVLKAVDHLDAYGFIPAEDQLSRMPP